MSASIIDLEPYMPFLVFCCVFAALLKRMGRYGLRWLERKGKLPFFDEKVKVNSKAFAIAMIYWMAEILLAFALTFAGMILSTVFGALIYVMSVNLITEYWSLLGIGMGLLVMFALSFAFAGEFMGPIFTFLFKQSPPKFEPPQPVLATIPQE